MRFVKRLANVFIFTLPLFISVPSFAGLIGDTILLSHRFPAANNVIEGYLVTVENGLADSRAFGGLYLANPEDTQVLVNFFGPFLFPQDPFNGHKIDFIDQKIYNISVKTNITGWDNGRLAFADHNAQFNWAGLSGDSSSYFDATFDFDNSSHVIPEPTTFAFLGIGLPFLAALRKRFQK